MIKLGDKLIANDEFHWSGFINGEVIEVTPYDNDIYDISVSNIIDFGVTILANFKSKNDVTGQEYIYQKNIYSCSLKINPINLEINIDLFSKVSELNKFKTVPSGEHGQGRPDRGPGRAWRQDRSG